MKVAGVPELSGDPLPMHDQFVLAEHEFSGLPGWRTRELAGWIISSHPSLRIVELYIGKSTVIGWLIGYPIKDEHVIAGGLCQIADIEEPDLTSSAVQRFLDSLGGRFAAIILGGKVCALYLDPGGTLACVYARDAKIAGATTTVVERALGRAAQRSVPATGELAENQFYPAGLTRSDAIGRLLPNHYLDLARWEVHRHRMHKAPCRVPAADAVGLSARIGKLVGKQAKAIAGAFPTYVPLTAGRDSRMVLASMRSVADRISIFTFDYGWVHDADVSVAQEICRRTGLNHTVVPIEGPTCEVKKQYLEKIGFAGHWGKSRDFYYAAGRYLRSDHAFLTGFGGEVGRGFYWDGSQSGGLPEATELLSVMRLPATARAITAMQHWLEDIQAGEDPLWLLDRLYLEQRLGAWAAPHMYGFAPFAANLTPFCHREIFDLMLQLPAEYVQEQGMATDIIRLEWPELGDLPYQREVGFRGLSMLRVRSGRRAARRIAGRLKRLFRDG